MGHLGKTEDGKYPDLRLSEAVDMVRKMAQVGPMNRSTLARLLGMDARGSGLHQRVEDLVAYGLIEANGELKLSPLGSEVAHGDPRRTWEAFLRIPLYQRMHERIAGRDVDNATLRGILHAITQADEDDVSRRITRLKNNYMEALQYLSPATGSLVPNLPPELSIAGAQVPSGQYRTSSFEMMESDMTMVEKGGKLYIVIDKDLDQVRQARSFLGIVEKKLEIESKKPRTESKSSSKKTESVQQSGTPDPYKDVRTSDPLNKIR